MVTDCCVALLGVYLPGYHVVPLLLLYLGLGPWSDYHCGGCHVRAVYVPDRLVRHPSAKFPK